MTLDQPLIAGLLALQEGEKIPMRPDYPSEARLSPDPRITQVKE